MRPKFYKRLSTSRTRAEVKGQGQRYRPRSQDYSLITFGLSQMDIWIQIKKNKKKIARIGMLTQFWKLLAVILQAWKL